MTMRTQSDTAAPRYSSGELMVVAASHEIRDRERVFVGWPLPMLSLVVGKRTHPPGAIGLYENGLIRDTPASKLLYTMSDPPNLLKATYCGDMIFIMSLLHKGR